ncbi:hypothetical protein DYI22_13585 [Marinobacter lipolyticus]|uniref:hypothetical protein n=1 Tax=Marinobacter lipolyticus TaxID=209639 RepID=UPI001BCDEFF5|nr:hypothetical protein [Marinobacter lipolyticus]MBS8241525.1 hypothetical protein [Marinobacter lipolyticus]
MKIKSMGESPGSDRQWWLTGGSDVCVACEVATHLEALAFCAVCDQTVCAICARYDDRQGPVLCPGCAEAYFSECNAGNR